MWQDANIYWPHSNLPLRHSVQALNLHDFHSGSGANFNLGAREHDGENTCHPSKFHREEVQVPAEAQQRVLDR